MTFRVGINYWPRSSAMYWWRGFNLSEVEADFRRIRAAGFSSIRIFLLWEDFQPGPESISRQTMSFLRAVADICAEHDLSLIPTLFTGHMSGANWVPEWVLDSDSASRRFRVVSAGNIADCGIKNWYADRRVAQCQSRLAQEIAALMAGHEALWAWDLGNEPSNCVRPPCRDAGLEWLEQMTRAIRSVDPLHPVTIGLHMEDLEEDRLLGPAEVSQACDFLSMHAYSIYSDWAAGPSDPWVVPFLGCVTEWLGGKSVLIEEFGVPPMSAVCREGRALSQTSVMPLTDEEEGARFVRRALELVQQFSCLGALVWCYTDYPEFLWNRPPFDVAVHERYFGLWRSDGSAKPTVSEIRRCSEPALKKSEKIFDWAGLKSDEFYSHPKENLRILYRSFKERFENVT